jgi:hypothetical protein
MPAFICTDPLGGVFSLNSDRFKSFLAFGLQPYVELLSLSESISVVAVGADDDLTALILVLNGLQYVGLSSFLA